MSNSKSDWVNVNQSFSVFRQQLGTRFGELKTGMYLHINDSTNKDSYCLVGDINRLGCCCVCDCCRDIASDSIVVRYKMIELPKD